MTIEEVLEQRFSFALKDLIPVTKIQNEEDKKKEKYIIDYTLSEWKTAYPFLPAEYIFYAPVLASTNLVYFDEEKYIWLNLPIAGKEIFYNGPEDFEHYIKSVIAKQQKEYENKNFIPLFITMPDSIRMEIICQMPRRTDAKGLFYKTFKEFYPISTCFTNGFPTTIGRLLMESKSPEQIQDTLDKIRTLPRKNGKIIVYRGMADKSTPANKAISWTPDINIAYFFAIRKGHSPRVLRGYVDDCDVVEYFAPKDSEGAEEEIIVVAGKVQNISQMKLLDADSEEINESMSRMMKLFHIYKSAIAELYKEKGTAFQNPEHDALHTLRVLVYALILADMNKMSGRSFSTIATAVMYHDIGRQTDGVEPDHGVASKKVYVADGGSDEVAAFAIEFHCKSDAEAKKEAKRIFEKPHDALQILSILKDAAALDRLRFGYVFQSPNSLDVKQLRLDDSKQIVPFANQSIEQIKF